MHGFAEKADLHAGARHIREFHCTSETFVVRGVVVFQRNLELHGLQELPWLFLGTPHNGSEGLLEVVDAQL